MNKKTLLAVPLALTMALGFTACATQQTPQPVVIQETQTVTPEVDQTALEAQALELYHTTIPEDTMSDEEILNEAVVAGENLRTWMDDGKKSKDYFLEIATNAPDELLRQQALITMAIAFDPTIAQHENY